jgi:hypothetical protein
MDLLVPASGFATRMNQIPKFLLPVGNEGKTLLKTHMELASDQYERILIGTRPELVPLLDAKTLGENVEIFPLVTKTMSETIIKLSQVSENDKFVMVMPDTFFLDSSPHTFFSETQEVLGLALWSIRDSQRGKLGQVEIKGGTIQSVKDKDPSCSFDLAWGSMCFNREYLNLVTPAMSHIGLAISDAIQSKLPISFSVQGGSYFDCGTPREYFELIRLLTTEAK